MGKITGFLEYERNDRDYEPVEERVKHWREFVLPLFAAQPIVFAVAFVALIVGAGNARACDCPGSHVKASQLLKKDGAPALHPDFALFIGRVAAQSQPACPQYGQRKKQTGCRSFEPISTIFQIMRVLQGDLPERLTLTSITSHDNSCGLSLYVSQIVMLIVEKRDGEWTTNVCMQPRQDVTTKALLDFATKGEQ